MGKLREIWRIIKRKGFKDGDEVHAVEFNGGLMVSSQLMEKIKPKLDEMPDTKYLGDLYGVKILTTPHLPYIYREVRKDARVTAVVSKDDLNDTDQLKSSQP